MFERSPILAALVLAVCAAPLAAQCPDLDLRFAAPPSELFAALAVYDHGSGPRLYAGGSFLGMAAWDGSAWSPVEPGVNGTVDALLVHDFGAGRELVVGGSFTQAGGIAAEHIARWNGTSWSAIGAGFDNSVFALAVYDAGLGPKLVATGRFTRSGASPVERIAQFNGVNWSALAGGLDLDGLALAVFDDGTGSDLVVGGFFGQAGASPCAHVARWDGASWSPLAGGTDDAVASLLALGTPGSQTLVVGGAFTLAGSVSASLIASFDGTAWSGLGLGLDNSNSPVRGVNALLADGAGFIASGGFETFAAPGNVSSNIARWDGSAWQPLASGLGTMSYLGVEALARFDPNDGGGTRLFAGGGFLPQQGQPRSIAQWNGTTWSALRDDHAQGLIHQGGQAGSRSATMWQGELVIAGDFEGAGSAPDARGVARWDGTRWRTLGTQPAAWSYLDHPVLVETVNWNGGPELVLGLTNHFEASPTSVPLYRWNGVDWLPFALGAMPPETSMAVRDVIVFDDGSGTKLYAAGSGLRAQPGAVPEAIVRWNGNAWERLSQLPSPTLDGYIMCLEVYDDGSGPALYAGGSVPGGIQRWDGSAWSMVGSGFTAFPGIIVAVADLEAFDDGTGPMLYAGGNFHNAGNVNVRGVSRWNGTTWQLVPGIDAGFWFMGGMHVFDDASGAGERLIAMRATDELVAFDGSAWTTLAFTSPYFTGANVATFDDLPGGRGIVLHGNHREILQPGEAFVAQAGFTILRGCPPVQSYCAGDGLDAQLTVGCPCANTGGSGRGCAWSAGGAGASGARLGHQGSPQGNDLVLVADSMPATGSCLFFQGATTNAAGAVFGDGLRCAAGTVTRLRTRTNVAGTASVPVVGEPPLSSMGGVAPGSGDVRSYQVWFRVAASFCTSAPFNTTNALRVHW